MHTFFNRTHAASRPVFLLRRIWQTTLLVVAILITSLPLTWLQQIQRCGT